MFFVQIKVLWNFFHETALIIHERTCYNKFITFTSKFAKVSWIFPNPVKNMSKSARDYEYIRI